MDILARISTFCILISPPLHNQSVVDFATENSGALLSQGTNPTTYAIAAFNNNTGNYENYNSNSLANLIAGHGYRMATSSDNTNLKFTGTPIKGEYTVTIPIGTDEDYATWNLIGNPYSSYLDFDALHAPHCS